MTEPMVGPDTTKDVIHYVYPNGKKLNPEQLNPHVGGWLKKCKHIYEYVNAKVCPFCGRDTHEPDWENINLEIKKHYATGSHLHSICPIEGGTIRGWWSI